MIVRVARRAAQSARALGRRRRRRRRRSSPPARAHGVARRADAARTTPAAATASPRPARCSASTATTIVVNVQGDEPLIDAGADRRLRRAARRARRLRDEHRRARRSTTPPTSPIRTSSRSCSTPPARALYFSRAPIPWPRDARRRPAIRRVGRAPLRHVGLYAYRAGFLRRFPLLRASPLEAIEALEQLRVLWHGERIAVHVSHGAPGIGVDTPDDLERGTRPVRGECWRGFCLSVRIAGGRRIAAYDGCLAARPPTRSRRS